jgi:hypothetical protein
MYSGGNGYFQALVISCNSTHFLAMQSYKWLPVCLDTADQDFDTAEKLWLG